MPPRACRRSSTRANFGARSGSLARQSVPMNQSHSACSSTKPPAHNVSSSGWATIMAAVGGEGEVLRSTRALIRAWVSLLVLFQPLEQRAHAAGGESDVRIRHAIIQMERVAIGGQRVAARK